MTTVARVARVVVTAVVDKVAVATVAGDRADTAEVKVAMVVSVFLFSRSVRLADPPSDGGQGGGGYGGGGQGGKPFFPFLRLGARMSDCFMPACLCCLGSFSHPGLLIAFPFASTVYSARLVPQRFLFSTFLP